MESSCLVEMVLLRKMDSLVWNFVNVRHSSSLGNVNLVIFEEIKVIVTNNLVGEIKVFFQHFFFASLCGSVSLNSRRNKELIKK